MPNNEIDILQVLEDKFTGKSVEIMPGQLGTASIKADPNTHRAVVKTLVNADEKTAVVSITGIDLGATIGVFYHIRTSNALLTVKVDVPKENPKLQTINDITPSAAFHELEASDLLGVEFEGNPRSGHFVLPENWPEDVYPLRKDVNASEVKLNPPSPEVKSDEGNLVKIIIGPQHPALLEPEKFAVLVEGETVKAVEPRIGYVHRGIEKASESRSYLQDVYLVERICGICNSCHATAFVEAVEKILKTEVPSRGKYIRTIILEVNRLHSHLLTLGHAGLEIGYETLFQYFWRDREPIMDLIELTSGNRVYGSLITVGGVRRDLNPEHVPKIKSVDMDIRKTQPYSVYDKIPFKQIVYTEGDTWARMNVRLDEVEESINIIDYVLDHLPSGPVRVEVPRSVPAGEAVSCVEAPRGELFYYVRSNGTDMPDRVKIRTPTFANIPSFLKTAIGESIADVPSNFVSLDPCFSCTDR